jgi:hypothetical protein
LTVAIAFATALYLRPPIAAEPVPTAKSQQ